MRFNQSNKTSTAVWFLSFVQVELPATLAGIWLLDCAGRKKTTLALFLLLGPDAHACLSVGATIYATWLSSSCSCS